MSSDIKIPDHWQLATINDIQANEKRATITGPFGSSIGKRFFVSEGIPVIRGNNLSYKVGTFDDSGFVYITRGKANELKGYIAKPGDLIFTAAGTIGQVALIPFAARFEEYIISNKQMRVRLDLEKVDTFYAYYWFSCPMMNAYIKRQDTGSTIPLINLSVLRALPIPLPPIQEQRTIATILKSLDDKIDINHQINQTLEQMAQAIFKSWFVNFEPVKAKIAALEAGGSEDDALLAAMQAIAGSALFAIDAADADAPTQLARLQADHPEQYATLRATAELFPSAMQESELGEIPEGWSIATLADFGDVVCGKTPSKQKAEYYGSAVPFIKIPDMHGNVFVTKANEYLSSKGAASQPKKSIPKGSVCVSCIATVGLVVIAIEDSHTNQQINSIVPKKHVYTPYLYFRMQSLNKHLHDLASGGSATLNLNTSTFSKIQIIKPAEAVLEKYHEVTAQLLNKILEGSLESQTLSELRDTLLPKLLSGELSVSAATDQITQAEEAIDV